MNGFLQTAGRGLQLLALLALPASMLLQLQNVLSQGQMLVAMLGGAAMFWLGRIIEGYART